MYGPCSSPNSPILRPGVPPPAHAPCMNATTVGYARVSTTGQDLAAQEDALTAAGCERLYTDHGVSGARASRPQWDRCREHLRAGDTLVVTKLDRLGRSLRNVLEVVDDLNEAGVALRILDLAADTSTASGRMVLSVLGAVAELERELARERTLAGLEAARRRGRVGGRPRVADEKRTAVLELVAGGMPLTRAAALAGVSRATGYRIVAGTPDAGCDEPRPIETVSETPPPAG